MKAIIVAFIMILIACIALSVVFYGTFKANSKWARVFELVGYFFVLVSLFWGYYANLTGEMITASNNLVLNEKLNILYNHEIDVIDLERGLLSQEDFSEAHRYRQERWMDQNISDDFIETQDQTAKIIQYILLVASTILIASGRINELIHRRPDSATEKTPDSAKE